MLPSLTPHLHSNPPPRLMVSAVREARGGGLEWRSHMDGETRLKRCNRCEIWKPLDGFYRDVTKPLGASTFCKACTLAARAVFRENNRKKLKLTARRDRKRFPERGCWQAMLGRCYKPNHSHYRLYGERGIQVCARWVESFDAFLVDMGPRPSLRHTVDRVDYDGDYGPGNCRWATPKEQARNTRSNRRITIAGRTQCVAAWAEEMGVDRGIIYSRLGKLGWDPVRAVLEPIQSRGRH